MTVLKPAKKRQVSDNQREASKKNVQKAIEARKSNVEKQRRLREKYGIESSDSDDTSSESSDSEEEAIIVKTVKKLRPKKGSPLSPELSEPSDIQLLRNEIEEIKRHVIKKRAPRKQKTKVIEVEATPVAPEVKPKKEETPKTESAPMMKLSTSTSSLNSLKGETASEKIARLTARFQKLKT